MAEGKSGDVLEGRDEAVERDALAWMNDPYEHFGWSTTKLHSVPRDHIHAVQLAALNIRLDERRQRISVLQKLADGQGIDRIAELNDGAALLFAHDVYKSYPVMLLAKQKFDQLTRWLSRLTPHDLSGLDVSDCQTIDQWLHRIREETPLDIATSSGSSGTLSLLPRSKRDYTINVQSLRTQLLARFGEEPAPEDIKGKMHVVLPLHRDGYATVGRTSQYIKDIFCQGDEDYFHPCFNFTLSTDLMWLAGRLKAAQARGDVSKADVPPALLARRGEWEQQQRDMPAQREAFIRQMAEKLRGKRVFALGTLVTFYGVAKRALEEGITGAFGPGSLVSGGGGAKGNDLPPNVEQIICDFFGVERIDSIYGMTEINSLFMRCEHGHYHAPPFVIPYLLNIETGRALPRSGVQTGRAAFFDMTHDGLWGGIISGDQITIDWDHHCACGRTTHVVRGQISRLSELQGGDDKILCAAQPAAQSAAIDFLTQVDV